MIQTHFNHFNVEPKQSGSKTVTGQNNGIGDTPEQCYVVFSVINENWTMRVCLKNVGVDICDKRSQNAQTYTFCHRDKSLYSRKILET